MPLTIKPNHATDLDQRAARLYRRQFDKITQRAEQIRRERTQQHQEKPMPLSRTRAETETLPEPDDHQRIVDLEKIVLDMAVQIERLDQRLKKLEPVDPMIRPRRDDDDDDAPAEIENRIRRQVSGRAA